MVTTALLLGVLMSPPPVVARLQIAVTFDPAPPAAVEEATVAEAARIWAPYGVAIACSADATTGPTTVALRVAVGDRPPPGVAKYALGSIQFDHDDPQAVVSLYAGTAWELLSAAYDATHWPNAYRDATLGRVLGRALAHETGHFLLRSRTHRADGLMQARQPMASFMDERDGRFTLSAIEQTALDRLLPAPPASEGDVQAGQSSTYCRKAARSPKVSPLASGSAPSCSGGSRSRLTQ